MTPAFALQQAAAPEVVYQAVVTGADIALAAVIFGTVGAMLHPLVRALAGRLEHRAGPPAPALQGVEDRLDRIERAVESIAVEVERVSEGQRFVTKLLAEKPAATLPGAGE